MMLVIMTMTHHDDRGRETLKAWSFPWFTQATPPSLDFPGCEGTASGQPGVGTPMGYQEIISGNDSHS